MSDEQTTKTCEACGAVVTYTGHRGFRDAHQHQCPKAGTNAYDESHRVCPNHGTLVWVVGPYSTFRACGFRNCTAGKRGKPWRYCAPRGEYAPSGNSESRRQARDNAPAQSSAAQHYSYAANDEPRPGFRPPVVTWSDKPRDNSDDEQSTPNPTPDDESENTDVSANPTINLKSLGAFGDAIQTYVDARAKQLASEMITEALKDVQAGGPSRVDWTVNDKPFAAVEGAHHKALPRLLKLYAAGFRNFLIVGPAGSGKTTLAHNLATALQLNYGAISCTAGMSESKLEGKGIPNITTGTDIYKSTSFVRCYEGGGVFLLDEVDAADANVMLVINAALANGHMAIEARSDSPVATRHADSVIICAANTWGTGADRQYVGRNQLDAAFLDRYVGSTIEVDYDRDLEAALVGDANICARVWTVRDKARELKLRRVVGTRFLLSVTRLVKGAGETLDAALTACTVGWTDDERSKVAIRTEAK